MLLLVEPLLAINGIINAGQHFLTNATTMRAFVRLQGMVADLSSLYRLCRPRTLAGLDVEARHDLDFHLFRVSLGAICFLIQVSIQPLAGSCVSLTAVVHVCRTCLSLYILRDNPGTSRRAAGELLAQVLHHIELPCCHRSKTTEHGSLHSSRARTLSPRLLLHS